MKGENSEVTSATGEVYREGQSRAEGMLQIRFCPSRAPIVCYSSAVNGIYEGDDPEANMTGLNGKVG